MDGPRSDVPAPAGRRLVPRSRGLTWDVVRLYQQTPACAHVRTVDLSEVAAARSARAPRVSWAVLFAKAFGIVSAARPEFRQTFRSFPWPHVFQHARTTLMTAVHREFRGDPWVLWARLDDPGRRSLDDLQRTLDDFRTGPVEQVFRRQIQMSALPWPLRRMLWWWTLQVSGEKRAARTGTGFLTTLAGEGTEIPHPPSFQTVCLSYGPLDEQGRSRVVLSYDHRLMDGRLIALGLHDLERALRGPLLDELRAPVVHPAPAGSARLRAA
jgi:hypothetical protein